MSRRDWARYVKRVERADQLHALGIITADERSAVRTEARLTLPRSNTPS